MAAIDAPSLPQTVADGQSYIGGSLDPSGRCRAFGRDRRRQIGKRNGAVNQAHRPDTQPRFGPSWE
jgi:hypothetical protein